MKKSIALVAMCATALSPVLSTAAYADTVPAVTANSADGSTVAAMGSTCDLVATGYEVGNDDRWSADIVVGAVSQVGTTDETDEVLGTRDVIESSIMHAGTYVPSTLEIRGDPFRNGGSVNMFGNQWSTAGYWTDSTYNFTADYDSTFAHAFSCAISQEVYHPPVLIPGHGVIGHYVVDPDANGNEEAKQNSCNAFNAQGTSFEHYGEDHGQCLFVVDEEATEDSYTEEYYDAPALVATLPQTAIEQDQTDTLTSFEDHGGPVQVTGELFVGKAVICISPGSKGGAWRVQNGYTGTKCTTDWFKVAPTPQGSTTSNGTYTSVPNYTL